MAAAHFPVRLLCRSPSFQPPKTRRQSIKIGKKCVVQADSCIRLRTTSLKGEPQPIATIFSIQEEVRGAFAKRREQIGSKRCSVILDGVRRYSDYPPLQWLTAEISCDIGSEPFL